MRRIATPPREIAPAPAPGSTLPFYIMFFSALAAVALFAMRETAQRPLLGSVPTVETIAEAEALVAGQDDDPRIDTSTMPLDIVRP